MANQYGIVEKTRIGLEKIYTMVSAIFPVEPNNMPQDPYYRKSEINPTKPFYARRS